MTNKNTDYIKITIALALFSPDPHTDVRVFPEHNSSQAYNEVWRPLPRLWRQCADIWHPWDTTSFRQRSIHGHIHAVNAHSHPCLFAVVGTNIQFLPNSYSTPKHLKPSVKPQAMFYP